MKVIIILIMWLIFAGNALANGTRDGGTIVHIASVNEAILFNIAGNTESSRPACATTGRFSVHKDSVHASIVLLAFSSGKQLRNVRGTGTCTFWSNSEDIRWIEVCPLAGC